MRAIAMAFDGSPESRTTLRAAHGLATPTDATLRALMVDRASRRDPGPVRPRRRGLSRWSRPSAPKSFSTKEQASRVALDSALPELGNGAGIEQDVLFDIEPAAASSMASAPVSICS
jgi:nucleotide-binding universal stress UspA family protein